jgi:uncharacterized protein (TIGR02001 family)
MENRGWLALAVLMAIGTGPINGAAAQEQTEESAGSEDDDFAGGSFSGNLRFATNYMFRGISQTDDGPQIQGDVTWAHNSGFYAGVWSSNTDAGGPGNSMEFDPFIGFSQAIGDTRLTYDVGFWYYSYPGSDFDYDYWEIYGILTYAFDGASIGGSVWYADNYFGEDFFDGTSAIAVETVVTFDLPENFALSGRIGRQTFDEAGGIGDQDYTYYDVGVSKVWNDVTFDVRWHDAADVTSALASDDNVGALVGSVALAF